MEKHWNQENVEIFVVYKSTNSAFEDGYSKVKCLYPYVAFIQEGSQTGEKFTIRKEFFYFKNYYNYLKYPSLRKPAKFRRIINEVINSYNDGLIFFLTDDSMFFETPIISNEIKEKIIDQGSDFMFSLRHGMNFSSVPFTIKGKESIYSYVIEDDFRDSHWSYKFSVDGHIYNLNLIKNISAKIIYSNPNSFESFLNTYSKSKGIFQNILFNFKNSLVGFELNRVQSFSNNNHKDFSINDLNEYFLNGYDLQYQYENVNSFRPRLNSLKFYSQNKYFEIPV